MKFLKTHYGRAINVIPSDTVNIPNPAGLGLTGTTDNEGTNQLRDSSANFTTNLLGAIVVNTTDNTIANIIGFISSETLILDADIFIGSTNDYAIYNSDNNQGCSIYIPAQTPDKLRVLTVGGDIITFYECGDTNASSILPVNVLRVFSDDTNLINLVALW
jgi:hypothetical protein